RLSPSLRSSARHGGSRRGGRLSGGSRECAHRPPRGRRRRRGGRAGAAAVVGVPDPRLGETLAAFIVPTDSGRPPRPEQLGSFARVKLAGFKIPHYWYTVYELPLNSAGKVDRATLRAAHLERQRTGS